MPMTKSRFAMVPNTSHARNPHVIPRNRFPSSNDRNALYLSARNLNATRIRVKTITFLIGNTSIDFCWTHGGIYVPPYFHSVTHDVCIIHILEFARIRGDRLTSDDARKLRGYCT